MSKFTLDQLTEGIRQRHVGAQYRRLTEKWNRTGLLRGLNGQNKDCLLYTSPSPRALSTSRMPSSP